MTFKKPFRAGLMGLAVAALLGLFLSVGTVHHSYAETAAPPAAGAAVTIAWSGIGTLVILKLVGAVTALRVTPEAEQMGLDVTLHGESIHS